jgi:hypothetical protein
MAFRRAFVQIFWLILLGPAFGVSSSLLSQEIWPGLESGPYDVGYTTRHEYDFSRTFRPSTITSETPRRERSPDP